MLKKISVYFFDIHLLHQTITNNKNYENIFKKLYSKSRLSVRILYDCSNVFFISNNF